MKKIKYQNIIVAIAVLNFIFSAGITTSQVNAASDTFEGQSQDTEKAELILESFEEGSYETWRKLVDSDSKIVHKIKKDDFYEFIKARNLARQGRYQEALDLYEDLKIKLDLSDEDINNIIDSLGIDKI